MKRMPKIDAIIRDYGPGLARIAASYEADPALQEDLLQDMLLAIHQALPALTDEKRLAPYLFRIAHNRGVSHVVRQVGSKRTIQAPEMNAEAQTPETVALAAERARRVVAAVRRLPLPYRQVMTLLLEELSYAEIGEALEISVSNVGVRVNRAKAQLKEMLDDP